jgi:hypothetical protein
MNANGKPIENVAEAWAIYDTAIVCETIYESPTPQGWFTSFANMAQQEKHTFFKGRTEANVGLQYCNMQSADTMDYAFECYSLGLTIFVPASNTQAVEMEAAVPPPPPPPFIANLESAHLHWFQFELPRHLGIQFKVQQDIRAELCGYLAPSGYGVTGSGTAFPDSDKVAGAGDLPIMKFYGNQGVPILKNRWEFATPIGIPRTSTIEGILWFSEYARYVMGNMAGPWSYIFQNPGVAADDYSYFPMRCGIQMSLLGKRLVQQRGQYHV